MQLKALIQTLGVVDVNGPLNREISGLAYDIRRVVPGSAFVAAPTYLGDGHQKIEEAVARGAVAIICQHNRISRHRATCVEVRDTKYALAEAARVFYRDPSSQLKVVAVVGGTGHATTSVVLKQLLENSGVRTGLIGSVRHEIGDRRLPAGKHFPEGLEVNAMLAEMVRADCKACVIELKKEDLVSRALSGVLLNTLVFANFGREQSVAQNESTRQLVQTLSNLPVCQRQACAVINIDEPAGDSIYQAGPIEVQLTYGLGERAEVRATNIHLGPKKTAFHILLGGKPVQCKIPLVGRHNVYSVLAAAGAALTLELTPGQISAAMNSLAPVAGNLEEVTQDAPFHVYVDGASSSGQLAQVLEGLREITPGRVILVVGARSGTTARERFELGKAAGEGADFTFLTADDPKHEPAPEIASTMAQGLEQNRTAQFVFEQDRAQAILRAISLARAGDSVLIAGKGERTTQEFADTIIPFDDRDCARECMESYVTSLPRERTGIPIMA